MKKWLLALTFISSLAFADKMTVNVPSIVCSACAKKITQTLQTNPDIQKIDVDVKAKQVHIKTSKPVSDETIKNLIVTEANHKVEKITRK